MCCSLNLDFSWNYPKITNFRYKNVNSVQIQCFFTVKRNKNKQKNHIFAIKGHLELWEVNLKWVRSFLGHFRHSSVSWRTFRHNLFQALYDKVLEKSNKYSLYPSLPKFRIPKNKEFRKILRFSMTGLLLKLRNPSIFYDQPSPEN